MNERKKLPPVYLTGDELRVLTFKRDGAGYEGDRDVLSGILARARIICDECGRHTCEGTHMVRESTLRSGFRQEKETRE